MTFRFLWNWIQMYGEPCATTSFLNRNNITPALCRAQCFSADMWEKAGFRG